MNDSKWYIVNKTSDTGDMKRAVKWIVHDLLTKAGLRYDLMGLDARVTVDQAILDIMEAVEEGWDAIYAYDVELLRDYRGVPGTA